MTAADRLVVGALLLAALGGSVALALRPAGERVVVSDGERVLFTAPLTQDGEFACPGPLGETRLAIDAQGVRIVSSPCALKTCMGMGRVRHPGELLACLPNRILVQIEGHAPQSAPHDLLSR